MSSFNSGLNAQETELSLGLPGLHKQGTKRRFYESVDLKLGQFENDEESEDSVVEDEKATPKAQVVGWPPVRAYRKNITIKNCKYVKVAVDGAPYLRKVDLEMFSSYQHLLNAFHNMFTCLTFQNVLNEKKLVDSTDASEYVATYEDKDGDWMLLGDVPWKMFVESCKKMRLMTSSNTIGLAARTQSFKSLTASC